MVIFYGDKNNNNQIDFRFSSQKEVQFNICDPVANILVNGNILYLAGSILGRPIYINNPYQVYYAQLNPSVSGWVYVSGGITGDSSTPLGNYPWLAQWESETQVEKYCS